ncbi:MAG: HEAT repeat domain-containing protein [Candidatus Heimdallarchaeaceae archaeon]
MTIEDILKLKKKPKEIVELLAEDLKNNKNLMKELINYFEKSTNAEKGHCMEALEYITKEDPEFVWEHLGFVIQHINDSSPRVKWESARIIGNIAHRFPDRLNEAVPKLLENTKDKSTVVRWSAAFALTKIAKSNPELQLTAIFNEIVKREPNKGVKNIYLKYLNAIEK